MLYDRSYMKNNFSLRQKSICDYLIIILIICFILQSVCDLFLYPLSVTNFLCFGYRNFTHGYFWTILTYSFVHDGLFHLLANLIGIHFISRHVEEYLGSSSFIRFSILCLIFGLLFWSLFNLSDDGSIIGCSALVLGCLTFFCLTRPNQPITLLLFFILPLSLKPKIILWSTFGIELYGFIFNELNDTGSIAHTAHLGGMLVGFLFFNFHNKNLKYSIPFRFTFNKIHQNLSSNKTSKNNYRVNFVASSSLKEETDRILDKINEKGFGALSAKEKETLEKAKKLFRS